MNRFLLACALVALITPASFAADDAAAAEQQITARSKEFAAAWDKHDAKAFAEFYTDNAELVTAKQPGRLMGIGSAADVLQQGHIVDVRALPHAERLRQPHPQQRRPGSLALLHAHADVRDPRQADQQFSQSQRASRHAIAVPPAHQASMS